MENEINNTMRMKPEKIIVGEIRDVEVNPLQF